MTEPCHRQQRSYAGFNPARADDHQRLAAILQGDGIARGFRNQDIRVKIYGCTSDTKKRQRQAATIGRFLKRCHVREWIARVPHSQRWLVTTKGRALLSSILHSFRHYAPLAA